MAPGMRAVTKGLLAIHTGPGKGKTTAAFGLAFRALGHGHKVSIIQFIKGSYHCGEHKLAQKFADSLELHVTGQGFTWKSKDPERDKAMAVNAWELAKTIIAAGKSRLVILDELTYIVRYGMVSEEEIIQTLASRPQEMHVVITGRHATPGLMAAADLVTEMNDLKHPYRAGIAAQRGFDF